MPRPAGRRLRAPRIDEAERQWERRSLEIAQALSSLLVVIEKTGVGAEPVDQEADTN